MGTVFGIVFAIIICLRLYKMIKIIISKDFWIGIACYIGLGHLIVTLSSAVTGKSLFRGLISRNEVEMAGSIIIWGLGLVYIYITTIKDKKNVRLRTIIFDTYIKICMLFGIFIIWAVVVLSYIALFPGVHPINLFMIQILLAGWIVAICKCRPLRMPLVVMLQLLFLGFLAARLTHSISNESVTAVSNSSLLVNDNAVTLTNDTPIMDPVTIISPHDTLYADFNQPAFLANQINEAASINGNVPIEKIFPLPTRNSINDMFGFNVASASLNNGHIALFDDSHQQFCTLAENGTGGYTISNQSSYLGTITAQGTVLDQSGISEGRIHDQGNQVIVQDAQTQHTLVRYDKTTGALLNEQGMQIGKVHKS